MVFVPGLEAMLREAEPLPGRMRRMLAAARRHQPDDSGVHGELITGQPVAPAALTRLNDRPDDAGGLWLRADPVRLTPDLGSVWMQAGSRLENDDSEQALIECLGRHGLELDFPHPERGYVRLQSRPRCRFTPPWALTGSSMEHVLPRGEAARFWRSLLNEVQMELHEQRRRFGDSAGIPDGLWFWGAGELPEPERIGPRVDTIRGGEVLIDALADWLGLDTDAFDARAPAQPGTLVVWPVDFGQSASENLGELLAWLKHSWRRLRFDYKLARLELAGLEQVYGWTTGNAWRLWR